jgi:hypothetical protein
MMGAEVHHGITTPEYGTSLPSCCELQLIELDIVMGDGVRFDG